MMEAEVNAGAGAGEAAVGILRSLGHPTPAAFPPSGKTWWARSPMPEQELVTGKPGTLWKGATETDPRM
jgi:hypothetical protein